MEGQKTEPQYFAIFNNPQRTIRIECIEGKSSSSPKHVLERMKRRLSQQKLKSTDEAWLVVDKDQWTEEQLRELYEWSQQKKNYGFALSNPKFEYWLLLHFEEGTAVQSPRDCDDRLKKHLPNYRKTIDRRTFTKERIRHAIHHAKTRDSPPCVDWPRNVHNSTVYRLVENILNV